MYITPNLYKDGLITKANGKENSNKAYTYLVVNKNMSDQMIGFV